MITIRLKYLFFWLQIDSILRTMSVSRSLWEPVCMIWGTPVSWSFLVATLDDLGSPPTRERRSTGTYGPGNLPRRSTSNSDPLDSGPMPNRRRRNKAPYRTSSFTSRRPLSRYQGFDIYQRRRVYFPLNYLLKKDGNRFFHGRVPIINF